MINTIYKTVLILFFIGLQFNLNAQLVITAIFDGTIPGGDPKGIELYATAAIADLGNYDVKVYHNGNTNSSSIQLQSGMSLGSGEYYYLTKNLDKFFDYFAVTADQQSGSMNVNGDDVVALELNGTLIDVYGVIGVDGSGEAWEYMDGWAYRNTGTAGRTTFNSADWTFSGANALDGCSGQGSNPGTNATCPSMIPIASYLGALPIELLNFSLKSTNSQVELNWSTATEQDNDYFQLERAGADRNFEPLAKIEGAVNSTVMQAYSYTDEAPLAGINYYRLVQVDLDGTVHYHNTLSYQDNAKGDLTLYPNPAKDQIIIETEEMIGGTMELRDLSGRVIQSSIITRQESAWSVSALQPGMYMITVAYNGLRLNNRFVKQ